MPNNHDEEAAKLSFDLTKQFLTLAVGGMAFVVGLAYSTPAAISSTLLWVTVGLFGCSVICGLLFLMHAVTTLSEKKSYDVYATGLRVLAGLQILLTLIGVAMLCPILYQRPAAKSSKDEAKVIQIQITPQQTLSYPVEPDKDYSIEIEGGKVTFSATK